jgi:hypothetical protein
MSRGAVGVSAYTLSTRCRDPEPGLAHPHDLPHSPVMEVVRYMRLQVFTVSPTEEQPYTCFETGAAPIQMCTAVISTAPENTASVELIMGGEAPSDAPYVECNKDSTSLTVALYQSDTRIAHAIIPLDQVWQV